MTERTFVPSAKSVPRKPLTLSYWQLASVVINDGEESYTTNLCQKCFNKHLQAKRKTDDKCAVKTGCGEEGVPWKDLENDGKNRLYVGCGNTFSKKETEQRGFERWLKKKSRQEHKVSGSRNRQPENSWSK